MDDIAGAEDMDSTLPTAESLEEVKSAVSIGGVKSLEEWMQKKQNEFKKIQLNIGVIGSSGVGKSSFINAMRGLTADDEGGAAVGTTETTMEPTSYEHPDNKSFKLWDLPGVGTGRFPKETYLDQIGFDKYDFFLLLSADRFTEVDIWLGQSIIRHGKKFYYVRTKVAESLRNDRKAHPKFHSAVKVIETIRQDMQMNLAKMEEPVPCFLIDSYSIKKYDYEALNSQLLADLPALKRRALLMTLSRQTESLIDEKVKVLRAEIWQYAAISEAVAAVPLPGLSITVQVLTLIKQTKYYMKQLGLDDETLQKHAQLVHQDWKPLKDVVTKKLPPSFSTAEGIKALMVNIPKVGVGSAVEEVTHFIPLIGPMIAASLSFGPVYFALNHQLNKCEDAAKAVVKTLEELAKNASNDADDDED